MDHQAEKNLKVFLEGNNKKNKGRLPNERYASFDYCFNYFQSFKRKNRIVDLANKKNLQQSCLQLGFYLASWGMLRGSSFLLEKSVRNFTKLIKEIPKFNKAVWNIDVNNYTDNNIQILLETKEKIKIALGKENNASDVLTTKIMLGVFGNIPAFDEFFKNVYGSCCEKNLKKIAIYYKNNEEVINKYQKKTTTFDFYSGNKTKINYTKAKVVDMIGFIKGQNLKKTSASMRRN